MKTEHAQPQSTAGRQRTENRLWGALGHMLGLALAWGAWLWLAAHPLEARLEFLIAVGGVLALFPVVLTGRFALDRLVQQAQAAEQPYASIRLAEAVTAVVHYTFAILFGSAVICATRQALTAPDRFFGDSPAAVYAPWLGLALMLAGGLALAAVVFNLLLKGLGLPFALALTRQVASEWMYAWTRNPMVLSALAFLVGLGLWLGSAPFLVWVLVVVSPAALIFLKVYEERELEMRFGEAYLEYKRRTPMLFPRRPG